MNRKALEEEIHMLEVQIRLNGMLPIDVRCDDAIARMKLKLAQLLAERDLKIVASGGWA